MEDDQNKYRFPSHKKICFKNNNPVVEVERTRKFESNESIDAEINPNRDVHVMYIAMQRCVVL
jgi:hypothetical protein